MNSPVQNNVGRAGRQFLEPVSSRPSTEVGRLSGQEVRNAGFSWGTAGRILAGIVTLGLSEAGYAIYKACTRPSTDNDRPMGGAKAYLKGDEGPAAKMLSDRPGTASASLVQGMPVGSLAQTFEAQHRERMDKLLGTEANYDLDEVSDLKENGPAIQDKAALAKLDVIDSWNTNENKSKLNIDGWEAQVPKPFAKDAIDRGDVRVVNGKLVAILQGEEFSGAAAHKLEKMELVDAFTSVTLAPGDGSDDIKGIFKQNLFSFTHQGAAAMFLKVINDQTGLSPLDPDGAFNFTFSAQDGQNVIVEQRFNADNIQCFGNSKGAPQIQEMGPFRSEIIFSVPIDQLKRNDFDPSCITVISADWKLNS
jgi:hypothetical protein